MKDELLARIFEKVPTQKKRVADFFSRYPDAELGLDEFLRRFGPAYGIDVLADAYVMIVAQSFHSRVEFLRTGRYPLAEQSEAIDRVYAEPSVMREYMLGLSVSYFLWEQHYRLYGFHEKCLEGLDPAGRFLEVGCGAGLFLVKLIDTVGPENPVDVVDISSTSIALAREALDIAGDGYADRVRFHEADVTHFDGGPYDFIGMGEVLEHVDSPSAILEGIRELLSASGRLYITTCANCPTIDHVHLFGNVDDIRATVTGAGYRIIDELVAPSENKPQEYLERYKVDISYAALLGRT